MRSSLSPCLLASLAMLASAPTAAQPSAQRSYADPAAIDRLVEGFTGQSIGSVGGARAPVDRRLRLAACTQALSLDWHGAAGRSVAVSCDAEGGWRIFVNVLRAPASAAASAPAIRRGEAVTLAVQGRGFSVQQQGEALEAGAVGAWIKVRTGRDRPVVRGQIVRPGLVVIPAG